MKLSLLTTKQKTRLLAELDGWTVMQNDWKTYNAISPDGKVMASCDSEEEAWHGHDYLTSYDAIIPLVQKLDGEQRMQICDLMIMFGYGCEYDTTPSQLCDAVLIATGKVEL